MCYLQAAVPLATEIPPIQMFAFRLRHLTLTVARYRTVGLLYCRSIPTGSMETKTASAAKDNLAHF